MLLSRVRKRFTKTKENVCEDDKARRGKGTSSKTTLLTSSFTSSKTILPLLLLCFSSFFSPLCSPKRRRRSERITHVRNVCWSSSPRKNNTMLCYILSLSLSCARRTNDAHTFTNNTFYYHETTTLVKIIQRKSKRKKLGNARKPRKRPRNARTTREPPRKAQGRFGWRKVYTTTTLLLSPRIF